VGRSAGVVGAAVASMVCGVKKARGVPVDREVLCGKLSPRQPEMYGSLLFSQHFFFGDVRSPKAEERFSFAPDGCVRSPRCYAF
jgi:hypothetical protein